MTALHVGIISVALLIVIYSLQCINTQLSDLFFDQNCNAQVFLLSLKDCLPNNILTAVIPVLCGL